MPDKDAFRGDAFRSRPWALLGRVSLAVWAFLAAQQGWVWFDGHRSERASLANARRFMHDCDVCINAAGLEVCGSAEFVDRGLALRWAWFEACRSALPHLEKAGQTLLHFPAHTRRGSACDVDIAIEPRYGVYSGDFGKPTPAEVRCLAQQQSATAPSPDEVAALVVAVEKDAEQIPGVVEGQTAAARQTYSALWRTCLEVFPRLSAACWTEDELEHTDKTPPWAPDAVAQYGKASAQ